MGWKVLGLTLNLALEAIFLSGGEAGTASPRGLASWGETIWALSALALQLEASLALFNSAFSSSEIASLLAPDGGSNLASWLRAFAATSEATVASLVAPTNAFPLALRGGVWLSSVKSWSNSQPETMRALPKAETRDFLTLREAEVDFLIQIALEAYLASPAA